MRCLSTFSTLFFPSPLKDPEPPEMLQELPHSSRVKRQESSSQAVNGQLEAGEEAERLETEEADAETFSSTSATSGRNAALSAAILRVLEVANAKPTPVDPTGSYSGRRRRSAQLEPVQSNDAETFAAASTTPGRNAALSAAVLRVLEVSIILKCYPHQDHISRWPTRSQPRSTHQDHTQAGGDAVHS